MQLSAYKPSHFYSCRMFDFGTQSLVCSSGCNLSAIQLILAHIFLLCQVAYAHIQHNPTIAYLAYHCWNWLTELIQHPQMSELSHESVMQMQ